MLEDQVDYIVKHEGSGYNFCYYIVMWYIILRFNYLVFHNKIDDLKRMFVLLSRLGVNIGFILFYFFIFYLYIILFTFLMI
jgi:hypothetical protein